MPRKPGIAIKRIYDPVGEDDGHCLLVDRLWPRGVSRPEVALVRGWLAKGGRTTFLYAARDTLHNNALALRDYLRR